MLVLWAGCKDKADETKPPPIGTPAAQPVDLAKRCEQFGKVCADTSKHVDKMIDECKAAAKVQVDKGCKDKAVAAYDCYEKELCLTGDKVWTLDDMRVLSERHAKCAAERDAIRACTDK